MRPRRVSRRRGWRIVATVPDHDSSLPPRSYASSIERPYDGLSEQAYGSRALQRDTPEQVVQMFENVSTHRYGLIKGVSRTRHPTAIRRSIHRRPGRTDVSTDDRTSRQTAAEDSPRRDARAADGLPHAEPGPRAPTPQVRAVTPVQQLPRPGHRRPDRPAAADPRVHPRLGGALRLPAERARDRRGGRAGVAVQRGLPAQGAGAEGLPAPRPEPAARGGRAAAVAS